MIQIILNELKNRGNELANFLQDKLKIKSSFQENKIIIEEPKIRKKDVKTYLKKFLYKEQLRQNYRIFVEKDVIKIEKKEEEEK